MNYASLHLRIQGPFSRRTLQGENQRTRLRQDTFRHVAMHIGQEEIPSTVDPGLVRNCPDALGAAGYDCFRIVLLIQPAKTGSTAQASRIRQLRMPIPTTT